MEQINFKNRKIKKKGDLCKNYIVLVAKKYLQVFVVV